MEKRSSPPHTFIYAHSQAYLRTFPSSFVNPFTPYPTNPRQVLRKTKSRSPLKDGVAEQNKPKAPGYWSETQTSDGTAFVGRKRIEVDGKKICMEKGKKMKGLMITDISALPERKPNSHHLHSLRNLSHGDPRKKDIETAERDIMGRGAKGNENAGDSALTDEEISDNGDLPAKLATPRRSLSPSKTKSGIPSHAKTTAMQKRSMSRFCRPNPASLESCETVKLPQLRRRRDVCKSAKRESFQSPLLADFDLHGDESIAEEKANHILLQRTGSFLRESQREPPLPARPQKPIQTRNSSRKIVQNLHARLSLHPGARSRGHDRKSPST
ncbi:hypothetical protein HYDPIDRAFT_31489 [Hydnomerulius pinastri MD-312]|uniref:Uncharacterized protein n=1 Tax=Hydnomerulius pinastri MD-312 TaxID=994086 RepID=A0A0C9WBH6_9AGAM|nr:hypothetical protein HYDPIDRAFT_31489 [Hydnomerulius pinastri MD-312]